MNFYIKEEWKKVLPVENSEFLNIINIEQDTPLVYDIGHDFATIAYYDCSDNIVSFSKSDCVYFSSIQLLSCFSGKAAKYYSDLLLYEYNIHFLDFPSLDTQKMNAFFSESWVSHNEATWLLSRILDDICNLSREVSCISHEKYSTNKSISDSIKAKYQSPGNKMGRKRGNKYSSVERIVALLLILNESKSFGGHYSIIDIANSGKTNYSERTLSRCQKELLDEFKAHIGMTPEAFFDYKQRELLEELDKMGGSYPYQLNQ